MTAHIHKPDCFYDFQAIHFRHIHIEYEHINRIRFGFKDIEYIIASCYQSNIVASMPENPLDYLLIDAIVLGDQDIERLGTGLPAIVLRVRRLLICSID
jgi:hypothetical protein